MCGRYVSPDDAAIEREFNVVRGELQFPANFNVVPSYLVPVIRSISGTQRIDQLRWGIIPYFAKGVAGKYATHIAKMETIRTLASYRGPWKRGQRCLFLAQGFYEWQLQDDGKTKIPFYITTNDQATFAIAGIWESSRPEVGDPIESAALITLPANRVIAAIHNSGANAHRMPAILRVEDRDKWLNASPDEAYGLLKPYPDEQTVAWPVSTRVNRPGNNDPTLVEPVDQPRAALT